VRNKEKAKIHIGDRIPIVNATSVPSTQGPVTTETVQYLDTGIKLEVEPTIYQSDEVAIKITMEVSDSTDQGTTTAGTTLVRVKTTNAQTSLRLKNGETQILAGLIRNDHTANVNGLPGLVDIPGAGRFFGSHKDDFSKRELVLSITPRIVRNTPYLAPHLLEYGTGTEGSLRSRPLTMQTTTADSATPVTLTAPPGTPGGASSSSGTLPVAPTRGARVSGARTPPVPQVSTPNPPATPGGNTPVAPATPAVNAATPPSTDVAAAGTPAAGATPATPGAASGGPSTLAFDGNNQLKVGQETTITLNLHAESPLVSTSFQLGFDPKLVKVEEVTEGNVLRADGVQTTFSSRIDAEGGRIIVGIARPTDNGTTGEGPLLQVKLSGVAAAESTSLRVLGFSAVAPGNRIQPVTLPQVFNLVVEP
jgi:general secretion pathway protein D